MCNDALPIALAEDRKSGFRLIELPYPRLKEHGLRAHHILSTARKLMRTAHAMLKEERAFRLGGWDEGPEPFRLLRRRARLPGWATAARKPRCSSGERMEGAHPAAER